MSPYHAAPHAERVQLKVVELVAEARGAVHGLLAGAYSHPLFSST